jgi:hypothetical protein
MKVLTDEAFCIEAHIAHSLTNIYSKFRSDQFSFALDWNTSNVQWD